MNVAYERVAEAQRNFCVERGAAFVAAEPSLKMGFALSTVGRVPINGLRHPAEGDTCGWYVWCGEQFSSAPDFFAPMHVEHSYDDHPELAKLLGLAPGYRFLAAGDYVDVWFDAALLVVGKKSRRKDA